MELLKGLSQVVPGSGDSTAGSVGVCVDGPVCVCASVYVCLLLNQHYLVFVQIVAGYLPPANTSVCVFLAKPPGPFVRGRSQLVSLAGLSQQQAHPHHCPTLDGSSCFIWEITAQLSPLVSNFLSALTEQRESVFINKQR